MSFTPFIGQQLRDLDILCLRTFVPAAEQDDDCGSPFLEIDAVAGAGMNA